MKPGLLLSTFSHVEEFDQALIACGGKGQGAKPGLDSKNHACSSLPCFTRPQIGALYFFFSVFSKCFTCINRFYNIKDILIWKPKKKKKKIGSRGRVGFLRPRGTGKEGML